jgi:mgtE-like transporter
MRRGIGRVFAYWRAERRTIAQGLVAMLLASAASLVAGIALGSISGTLRRLPSLMVLLPAAIAIRGNIFGALASRLGTGIHTGLFVPGRERQGLLYQNVFAAAVLTLVISWLVAVLAKLVSVLFGEPSMSILDFMVISVLGGLLASFAVGFLAVALSIGAYRRGWDLDSVAAPLITASGDMLTIPALFLATFIVAVPWVTAVLAGLATVVTVGSLITTIRSDLSIARRVVRESLPILALAGTVDLIAGIVVESRLEGFLAFPVLLTLIPPILGDAGGLGGILSSRLSSKLHLGALSPRGRPEAVAVLDFSIVLFFGVIVFPLVGAAAHLLGTAFGLESPGLVRVVGVSTIAGLLATLVAAVVAYYTAVATFRLGLDPDNHGIPTITSSMDLTGVIALVIALLAVGLGS